MFLCNRVTFLQCSDILHSVMMLVNKLYQTKWLSLTTRSIFSKWIACLYFGIDHVADGDKHLPWIFHEVQGELFVVGWVVNLWKFMIRDLVEDMERTGKSIWTRISFCYYVVGKGFQEWCHRWSYFPYKKMNIHKDCLEINSECNIDAFYVNVRTIVEAGLVNTS